MAEVRCICNSCKKEWSYDFNKEIQLKQEAKMGELICDDGICGNPYGNLFLEKLMNSADHSDEFDKCPFCSSKDILKKTPKIRQTEEE